MHPDSPITTSKDDLFERARFAKHLAACLALPEGAPSIVVGIEGKWGEGKTSCINLVREELANNPAKPIIVEYSPWLISTLDSLIEGFFVQLAAAVGTYAKGKNAQETAKKVLQFAKMLTPINLIPGIEPWGSLVEGVLSSVGKATQAGAELANLSLEARKKELQEYLSKLKRPIVVIVDDIDRLPPEHVRTVFQMLKAVADFPRVAYLTAYDPDPVAKALSFDGVYDGKAYLEKLIQISYPLPRISYLHRKIYLKVQVDELLGELGVQLSENEENLWESLLNKTDLVRLLTTPRDIVRLLNRLHLTVGNTKNEVCFADVAAFEALELKHYEIAKAIRQEPEQFIHTAYSDSEFWSQGIENYLHMRDVVEQEKGAFFKALVGGGQYTERDKLALKSLLTFMFPKLGETEIPLSEHPKGVNRIYQREALLKLLHSGLTSFTYSSVVARRFLSTPPERAQILKDWREANDISGWLSYVSGFLGEEDVEDSEALCLLLMEETKKVEAEPPLQSLSRQVGRFLHRMIEAISDTNVRAAVLRKVVTTPFSLAVSHASLMYFLKDAGMWHDGVFRTDPEEAAKHVHGDLSVSHAVLYPIKDEWLDTVRSVAAKDDIVESQRDPLDILYRWGQLNNNDYTEVMAYVADHMHNASWLQKFTKYFDSERSEHPPFLPDSFIEHIRKRLPDDTHGQELADAWTRRNNAEEANT